MRSHGERVVALVAAAWLGALGCGGCGGQQATATDAPGADTRADAGAEGPLSPDGPAGADAGPDSGLDLGCASDGSAQVVTHLGMRSDVIGWGWSHDGDAAVYADSRFGRSLAAVFLWDLSCSTEQQLSVPGTDNRWPHVRSGVVTWVEDPSDFSPTTVVQLDLASLQTTRWPPKEFFQTEAKASSGLIVMNTSRLTPDPLSWQLDLWEPATDEWTLLCGHQFAPEGHDFDGRHVTWAAFPDDSLAWEKDIFVHDVQTGQTRRIVKDPAMQVVTSVDAGRVVWMDRRNGNWDVYLYDLATDTESCVSCDAYDQVAPALAGNLVVWTDFRFGQSSQDAGGKNDLYVHDLDTNVGRRLTAESQTWVVARPVRQGRVAYLVTDPTSPVGRAGYDAYVMDLRQAGVLDADGHVVP